MICVSLAKMDYSQLRRILPRLAMAEIRLDEMALSHAEIARIFSLPLPLVATCRPGRYAEPKRQGMLAAAVASGAAYLDIEMDAGRAYRDSLQRLAGDHHCRIILSYHNHNGTPAKRRLDMIVDSCYAQGAEIVKVACRVRRRQDALRIIALYGHASAREGSMIALGMGAEGKWTRVAAPFLGAPFTYAALLPGKATAAGQIPASRMANMIAELEET
jgi:3-dehydroquinate dehydratase-1